MDIDLKTLAPLVDELTVPDAAEVSWTDVTPSAAHSDETGVLNTVYDPASDDAHDEVSLEVSVGDLSTGADWLDYAESGLESVDLNDLLDAGSVSAELEAIAILGENAASEPAAPEATDGAPKATEPPDVAHLSQELLFPQVTIVIDADADTDSVAI